MCNAAKRGLFTRNSINLVFLIYSSPCFDSFEDMPTRACLTLGQSIYASVVA